jgi:predicted translin family RNA/ssDNA-binding protein
VDVGAAGQDWSFVFEGHFSTKDEIQVEAEEYVVFVVDVAGRRRLE